MNRNMQILAALPLLALITCNGRAPAPVIEQVFPGIVQWNVEVERMIFQRSLDVGHLYELVDSIAEYVSISVPPDPAGRKIDSITQVIYRDLSIEPITDTAPIQSTLLQRVLDSKSGSCLGLVSLYLGIAEQLGMPLYGVLLPGHVFLRYQDDSIRFNIETLRAGISRTDSFYIDYFDVRKSQRRYLRNLSNAQVLALYYFNSANTLRDLGRYGDARRHYRESLRLFPQFREARDNLRLMRKRT
ncbi:MAG: tetratricopeptide repeat protein [Chitinivibrionales bacterium]|nr:tetratricopeptide repeat protein [Chitinivibrionales bacterium]